MIDLNGFEYGYRAGPGGDGPLGPMPDKNEVKNHERKMRRARLRTADIYGLAATERKPGLADM